MTKTNIQITRFKDYNYWVDIIDTGENYEAWLSHKDMGIGELMFGVPKVQSDGRTISYDEFCDMVKINLPEHKKYYSQEYS